MKMGDVFSLPIDIMRVLGNSHKEDRAAVHAINNHDKLVEMNKELVEALELIIASPKKAHMGGVDVQLNAEASVKIAEVFKKAKALTNGF